MFSGNTHEYKSGSKIVCHVGSGINLQNGGLQEMETKAKITLCLPYCDAYIFSVCHFIQCVNLSSIKCFQK